MDAVPNPAAVFSDTAGKPIAPTVLLHFIYASRSVDRDRRLVSMKQGERLDPSRTRRREPKTLLVQNSVNIEHKQRLTPFHLIRSLAQAGAVSHSVDHQKIQGFHVPFMELLVASN